MNKTGFIYETKYLEHKLSPHHPESPVRLEEILKELKYSGLLNNLTKLTPLENNKLITESILNIHSNKHFESVNNEPNIGEISYLAAAGVLGAVDSVMNKSVKNAFCAVRPPGHHAHNNGAHNDGRNMGEGFCFFNNIAIAAKYAINKCGLKKILIIDWDYHHGNGTEWAFYDNPDVFFFSTHNLYTYPGTGSPDRKGSGAGEGYNLNIPLPSYAEDSDIINAWEDIFLKKLDEIQFKPDLILISAGFDSRKNDYIGNFKLTDDCFAELTKITMKLADSHCDGRIISVLEGGYNPKGLAKAVNSHVKILIET